MDVLPAIALRGGATREHAVVRRLDQAGGRLTLPAMEPPGAATDRVPVRLQELAALERPCLRVRVTEPGLGRQRVGPLRTTRDIQPCVHRGAVDSAEVAGDAVRLTRAARGCLQRAARP
eukprot:4993565-Alexandrium_andersonii.AAC.1